MPTSLRSLRAVAALSQCVWEDLNVESGGIAWWESMEFRSRAGLGDYLLELLSGISTRVSQAETALEVFDELWRQHATSLAFRIQQSGGVPGQLPRESSSSVERGRRIDFALSGFFANISACLDQLAGVSIIVAALHEDALRADWRHMTAFLGDPSDSKFSRLLGTAAGSAGHDLQVGLRSDLLQVRDDIAPVGWIDWCLEMRNALSHRGDRVTMTYFYRPVASPLRAVILLPKEPLLSDVLAMTKHRDPRDIYFHKHAGAVMADVLARLDLLVERWLDELTKTWTRRSSQPNVLVQPSVQWKPSQVLDPRPAFVGFGTEFDEFQGQMVVNPWSDQRWRAAKLFDADRSAWE